MARSSRIFVEGRHDAELVEKVWGADLRLEGVVVELPRGRRPAARGAGGVRARPVPARGGARRPPGAGSKESRIADQIAGSPLGRHVLVVGHPFVDIWAAVKPERIGLRRWPDVPRDVEWKAGVCDHLGWPHDDQVDIARAWQQILSRVGSYADCEPRCWVGSRS